MYSSCLCRLGPCLDGHWHFTHCVVGPSFSYGSSSRWSCIKAQKKPVNVAKHGTLLSFGIVEITTNISWAIFCRSTCRENLEFCFLFLRLAITLDIWYNSDDDTNYRLRHLSGPQRIDVYYQSKVRYGPARKWNIIHAHLLMLMKGAFTFTFISARGDSHY